jgi:hypothetical protein
MSNFRKIAWCAVSRPCCTCPDCRFHRCIVHGLAAPKPFSGPLQDRQMFGHRLSYFDKFVRNLDHQLRHGASSL